jgi:16S rRNA (adenine1518-N6/adenine1519-N6)-dimethyltransferase
MTDNPYLDPQRIRAALNGLGVRPDRDLGQNFLIDPNALAAVVDAGAISPTDTVIEVGPGLGVLTHELVSRAGRVIAIEFDRRLAARLRDEFRGERFTVIQNDVLRVEPGEAVGAQAPYKVIANLPYQITSAILRHFLEAGLPPDLMVVMVQWEVAQRIIATPPDMSVLAHSVQLYAEPEIIARVPAASFLPAPRVDSAVLRLTRRPRPAVEIEDVDAFFRVIKAGFLHARKKLLNGLEGGLAAMGTRIDRQALQHVLEQAAVDSARRAETLTLLEWARIYQLLREDHGTR